MNKFIIVVRREGTPDRGRIYRGRDLGPMLRKISKDNGGVAYKWTPQMLTYLEQHYHRMTKPAIAAILSEMTQQKITKNAVIAKARDRGLCVPRKRGI